MPSEPLPTEVAVAAVAKLVPAVTVVQGVVVTKFPTSKKAKTCLQSCVGTVIGKLLPRNTSRTSLHVEEIGFPRSITLGLTTGRGYGIAHQTPRFHELVPVLHKLAATRPTSEQEPYLSVQVSYMFDFTMTQGMMLIVHLGLYLEESTQVDCYVWSTLRVSSIHQESYGVHRQMHQGKVICTTQTRHGSSCQLDTCYMVSPR
eukprot:269093-Amphidinium_carterae.1